MEVILWVSLGLAFLAVVAFQLFGPSLIRMVDRAAAQGDMTPLIAWIAKRSVAARPNAYNQAIKRLWDSYQRPLTVPLIRELAKNHGSLHIAQYWLDQLQKVEPELARRDLGEEFLRIYYQPSLAAQCGKVG
jgi:hypothetical protein